MNPYYELLFLSLPLSHICVNDMMSIRSPLWICWCWAAPKFPTSDSISNSLTSKSWKVGNFRSELRESLIKVGTFSLFDGKIWCFIAIFACKQRVDSNLRLWVNFQAFCKCSCKNSDVTLISDLKSQNAANFFVQGFGFEHTLFRWLEVRLERLYMSMVDLANSAKPITVNK